MCECGCEMCECECESVSASASVRVVGSAGLLQRCGLLMLHAALSGGGLILCM